MAEQNRASTDNITAIKPTTPDAGTPATAELPPNEQTVEPLDLIEAPKVRTKLRIYAILVALYVHLSSSVLTAPRAEPAVGLTVDFL